MAAVRIKSGSGRGVLFIVLFGTVTLASSPACRQMSPSLARSQAALSDWARPGGFSRQSEVLLPSGSREVPVVRGQTPTEAMPAHTLPANTMTPPEQVVEVRVVGARQTPIAEILRQIHSRKGRPFDQELIEEDVRRLYKTRKFVKVEPHNQSVPGGRIVIFEVLERPTLHYVKYVGNEKISKKKLEKALKETGVKRGDALDPFAVDETRRRLEEFYHSKGYAKASVTVAEGSKTTDRGAVFQINEGPKQQIGWTNFVGNQVASDARLRTKIQSKPGLFWVFKGEVNRKQIDEDVDRLTDYYRELGYFRARVSRLPVDPTKRWQMLTFVIDEGPRYSIRRVSLLGNARFSAGELEQKLDLKAGEFFHQGKMRADVAAIRDKYGAVGHIFADVNADLRFLEEPGQLDLVYEIEEGKPYRVGQINVAILGEHPHTRITTVLNRLSLQPGDLVDIRELRASERRLKASGLFEVDPQKGIAPQIVVVPPELEDMETGIAGQPERRPRYRGQSPDATHYRAFRPPGTAGRSSECGVINLNVTGQLRADPEPAQQAPATGPSSWIIRGQFSIDGGRSVPQLPQDPPTASQPTWQPRKVLPPPASLNPPYTYSTAGNPALGHQVTGTPPPADPRVAYPPARGSASYAQAQPATPGGVPTQPSQMYANHLGPAPGTLPPPATTQGGVPAQSSPMYGSQMGPVPGPLSPPGVVTPSGPMYGDSFLLGNPPNEDPPLWVDLNPRVYEGRTGRVMFTAGVNSDAGFLGSVILDEQNFDWRRLPTSWDDIVDGIAWRGDGQRFRLEAVPGTQVSKYTVSFQDPYWFDTRNSLGLSGFYYNRWYREWNEERLGGRVAVGRQLSNDLSFTLAFRGQKVEIFDPITPTPDELTEVLGSNNLFGFQAKLAHDTRDNTFLATEGHLLEIGVEQVLGTYEYLRGDIDFRKYFLLRQHPDGSGRHVLSVNARASVTSEDTPIYEHYYAGGFSTIRGFDFRDASPRVRPPHPAAGTLVGGHFMMLASMEYLFPITADGSLRGVVFCDTGTVEPSIDDWTDRYRVAPGFGLRILVPAMGPAPIALDFAFPVSSEPGDEEEIFSFFIGFLR